MTSIGQDLMGVRRTLYVGGVPYDYFSLEAAAETGLKGIPNLPFSLKILMENLLRHEDGVSVTTEDIKSLEVALEAPFSATEIAYTPARVLMQDFSGVPAIVDLAAMRSAISDLGGDPRKVNPQTPVDLVVDHSLVVDNFGTASAFQANVDLEMLRNTERYAFLKWGQGAFKNFRVV